MKLVSVFFLMSSIFASPYHNSLKSMLGEMKVDERNSFKVENPVYKKEQCFMFSKNNETFWKHRESNLFKIEALGDKMYKVRELLFFNDKSYYFKETPDLIPYQNQGMFYQYKCPDKKYEVKGEELEKVIEKLNKR